MANAAHGPLYRLTAQDMGSNSVRFMRGQGQGGYYVPAIADPSPAACKQSRPQQGHGGNEPARG